MANFTAAEIVAATGGRLLAGSPDRSCSGVTTDSRALAPGDCFIALRGEHFDGHAFVPAVLAAGASGVVVSEIAAGRLATAPSGFVIEVEDTLHALGAIARAHRLRFSLPVIGITGSTGKTTTKDMTAAILARRGPVAASALSLNNEIGVPQTLLALGSHHGAAVIEMAMRGPGEIAYLAGIARPTIGVVTNVGLSHLERLGSPDAIAAAKGELVTALGDGAAVLNAGDPYFSSLAALARGRIITCGLSAAADFRAVDITPADEATSFRLLSPVGEARVRLPAPGRHQVANALAAAAAAAAAGAEIDDIVAGLSETGPSRSRAQIVRAQSGFRIIDDSYNASPASVAAALDLLDDLDGRRKVAILGDMLELGPQAPALHRSIGEHAGRINLDLLIAVGELGRWIADGAKDLLPPDGVRWTDNKDQAAQWALEALGPEDVVLVKASRAMAFEQIAGRLAGA